MPLERRREIAAIAERHGLAIVEDDVHGLLPESRPVPLAALAPERSYYLTSTSKTLAPGLRIAYVAAPPRDGAAADRQPARHDLGGRAADRGGGLVLDPQRDRRRDPGRAPAGGPRAAGLAREALAGADFDTQPEAYYLWLRLPEPWRRDTFAAVLRARGVR